MTDDLTQKRSRREEVASTIASLESGRAKERARLDEYLGHIAAAKAMLAIGRRPDYDLEKLTEERGRIEQGISDIDGVLSVEREKLSALDVGIAADLAILKAHGVICQVGFGGKHDWEIVAYFDEVSRERQWRERKCRRCPTTERLGRH